MSELFILESAAAVHVNYSRILCQKSQFSWKMYMKKCCFAFNSQVIGFIVPIKMHMVRDMIHMRKFPKWSMHTSKYACVRRGITVIVGNKTSQRCFYRNKKSLKASFHIYDCNNGPIIFDTPNFVYQTSI